jgi:hypothetical protein
VIRVVRGLAPVRETSSAQWQETSRRKFLADLVLGLLLLKQNPSDESRG